MKITELLETLEFILDELGDLDIQFKTSLKGDSYQGIITVLPRKTDDLEKLKLTFITNTIKVLDNDTDNRNTIMS